jgi:hypothetical protein
VKKPVKEPPLHKDYEDKTPFWIDKFNSDLVEWEELEGYRYIVDFNLIIPTSYNGVNMSFSEHISILENCINRLKLLAAEGFEIEGVMDGIMELIKDYSELLPDEEAKWRQENSFSPYTILPL